VKKICERCGKEKDMLPWAHLCFRCAKEEVIEKTAADIRSGEETSTFAEDDVICPWCGYRYGSDELGYADWPEFFEDGEHGMFCDECGKPFTLTVNSKKLGVSEDRTATEKMDVILDKWYDDGWCDAKSYLY
jgi:hypothetical protein